jgi:hypothetical protein
MALGLVRIFGLDGALVSDLSGSSGELAFQDPQKVNMFQRDNSIALYALLVCVYGMERAVLFANENKTGSGETKIMIDLRLRS